MTELTRLNNVNYMGSHPRVKGNAEGIDIVFTSDGIAFDGQRRFGELGRIPWTQIRAIRANPVETVERRVSGIRFVLFGWIAWLLPIKRRYAQFVIEGTDGEWFFAVPGLSKDELREGLKPLQTYPAAI
jgi:hypothetical protein